MTSFKKRKISLSKVLLGTTLPISFLHHLVLTSPVSGFTAGRPAPWATDPNNGHGQGNHRFHRNHRHIKWNDILFIGDDHRESLIPSSTSLKERETELEKDASSTDEMQDSSFPDESSLQSASDEFHGNQNEQDDSKNNSKNTTMMGKSKPSNIFNSILEQTSSIRSYLGPLYRMMRPSNFPGVILFHVIGIHRTLLTLNKGNLLSTLRRPSMMITLLSLLLVTGTSMIVNDYFDGRAGVDTYKIQSQFNLYDNTLTVPPQGQIHNNNQQQQMQVTLNNGVPYPVAKRFLSYLYATLLISVSFVPGAPTRLSLMLGTMLTFWYTQHLKPKTWLKNVTCAVLMSLAPLTSGCAAMQLHTQSSDIVMILKKVARAQGRLTLALFSGFMGREILMDILDYKGDKSMGINTIPVRYGRRNASRVAMGFMGGTAILTVMGPIYQALVVNGSGGGPLRSLISTDLGIISIIRSLVGTPLVRRFLLAFSASTWLVTRGYQVSRQEGRDEDHLRRVIEEAKVQVLLVMASFI